MYRKYLLAGAAFLAFTAPALAAEFFVAQNVADKKCSVVETKPDGKTMTMVGKTSHKSKEEAEKAMAAAPECAKK
jgi:hypothetical protein